MNAKQALLFIGAAALVSQGCHSDKSAAAPSDSVAHVSKIVPIGWRVTTTNDVITLRREAPVWIMGNINRPPQSGTREEFFKRDGQEIHYELRLRFVPLLNRPDYERLRSARLQAGEKLKQGALGKLDYVELQKHYEQCQVPLYFTDHHSVFVDRWADITADSGYRLEPLFIEVYPPEAASEIDSVVKSLGKVFKEYANRGT